MYNVRQRIAIIYEVGRVINLIYKYVLNNRNSIKRDSQAGRNTKKERKKGGVALGRRTNCIRVNRVQ